MALYARESDRAEFVQGSTIWRIVGFSTGTACGRLRAMLEQIRNKLDVDSAAFFMGSRPSLDAIGYSAAEFWLNDRGAVAWQVV